MQRYCKDCDWLYTSTYHRTGCKFCGKRFDHQYCVTCHEWLPTERFIEYHTGKNAGWLQRECKKCNGIQTPERKAEQNKRHMERVKIAFENAYNEWLADTEIPFKLLKEDQWLKACAYFNGCAICSNEHVETRQFFIPFQKGGRYTVWNMFPMCGKCSLSTRRIDNPFKWLKSIKISDENKERLLQYFITEVNRCKAE